MFRSLIIAISVFYIVQFMLVNYTLVETKVTIPIEIPPYEESDTNFWGVKYTEEDLYCLALNVYFEARGEPVEGQYAVADVVLNRVLNADYPNTICEVVKQGQYYNWNPMIPIKHKCQFSWYCDGRPDNPVDGKAFKQALTVANVVLNDVEYEAVVGNALFYHANYVSPSWAEHKEFVDSVGNHLFYQ